MTGLRLNKFETLKAQAAAFFLENGKHFNLDDEKNVQAAISLLEARKECSIWDQGLRRIMVYRILGLRIDIALSGKEIQGYYLRK